MMEPEDWRSVLGVGLEGIADEQAVEGEGKEAVTQEVTIGSPMPLFLWGSESPHRKELIFHAKCCVYQQQEHERKKSSQNVQYASFLSSEKRTLLSDLMGINSGSKKTTHLAASY